jgi:ABC-type antimicrobial peptide transport system ATPase subunit
LNPPVGCRFYDRCPFAFERCREDPPFEEVVPGHFVACWLRTKTSAVAGAAAAVPVAAGGES